MSRRGNTVTIDELSSFGGWEFLYRMLVIMLRSTIPYRCPWHDVDVAQMCCALMPDWGPNSAIWIPRAQSRYSVERRLVLT